MKNIKLTLTSTIVALAMQSSSSFNSNYFNKYQLTPKQYDNKKLKRKINLSKKARRNNS